MSPLLVLTLGLVLTLLGLWFFLPPKPRVPPPPKVPKIPGFDPEESGTRTNVSRLREKSWPKASRRLSFGPRARGK